MVSLDTLLKELILLTLLQTLLLTISFALSFAHAETSTDDDVWQARVDLDHPLVGRWLDSNDQLLPDKSLPPIDLTGTDVLFLGENHGHPDHHAMQLRLLKKWLGEGQRFTLAFEIFDLDDQPIIDAFQRAGNKDADALAEAVGMADRGWPWEYYRPLVSLALEQSLPIRAINLSREQARAIAQFGWDAVPDPSMRTRLQEPGRFDQAVIDEWESDIIAAHCGYLNPSQASAMLKSQQARDAAMAEALAQADLPVIVIVGSEHARLDRGVPLWLRELRPDWRITSVGMTPVQPDLLEADDYRTESRRFDWRWFTPRKHERSACERFREQLESMRQPSQ